MPDAVNTSSLEYKYLNPVPGSVAPASSAVGQTTESSHTGNNPAFATAYEQVHGGGQQEAGIRDPETPDAPGAQDQAGDNPGAQEDSRDRGPTTSRP